VFEEKSHHRRNHMKLPYSCSRVLLAVASAAALVSGRRSATDELQDALDTLTGKRKAGEILAQDPAEVSAEEVKKWESRHPGLTLNISYPDKDPFDLPVQLKETNNRRFSHPKMKKPPRLWQPNGQVPFRPKQEGLETLFKKTKSPYR
jgi:hypothetical protein